MFAKCVTLDLRDPETAEQFSTDATFRFDGYYIDVDGAEVTITEDCLRGVFGDLPEEEDGHYDGTAVWISGTSHTVRPANPEFRATGGRP